MAAEVGEIVAINGPPGTGKTTLILSVVASYWVNAALDGGDPPVIVATSTNNQAVTNVIEAFGKSVDRATGVFAGRWLPEVEGHGSYFPAQHLQADAATSYQTEAFFDRIETDDYVTDARGHYLAAGRLAYPHLNADSVDQIVDALHVDLCETASDLRAVGEAWDRWQEADEQLRVRIEFVVAGNAASREVLAVVATVDWFEMLRALEQATIDEPFWWTMLGWLASVRRKRLLATRQVVEVRWPSMLPIPEWESAEQIEADVRGWAAVVAARQEARSALDFSIAAAAPGPGGSDRMETDPASIQSLDALETLCDRTVRFRLFVLATHYWEGRWLQAIDGIEVALADEARKTRLDSSVDRWHRRMMVTPCAVATLFTLPGRFTYGKRENSKIVDRYLDDFIDLLIVDEAGQVTPEVGGAAFGLAKRGLVIGDTAQLEPIWSTGPSVDIANLKSSGIIRNASDFEDLGATGVTASSGSLMRIAQQVCRHHQVPEMARGLYLFEHRRCRAEIIGYSNALCYDGKLQPLRAIDPDEPPSPVPTLAYVHVDGRCQQVDASNANEAEAKAVAAWIAEHRSALERHYAKPIDDVVAVVTPFRPQADRIAKALAEHGIVAGRSKGSILTVGTVHALQGAERPVVLFSHTYSKHLSGSFIDRSPNMLNVAVSRAQDSFVLFGDMDALTSAGPRTPRGLLYRWFLDQDATELTLQVPLARPDLDAGGAEVAQLIDAGAHDQFLVETLAAGLSPSEARAEHDRALDRLIQVGVDVWELSSVHSKAVFSDRDDHCLGSFNWLSARRDDRAQFEASTVRRGSGLDDDIDTMLTDLANRRVTR